MFSKTLKFVLNHKIILIITWKHILVITLLSIGYYSQFILGKDNLVEKKAEEIIFNETGIKVDLTPENKMKK